MTRFGRLGEERAARRDVAHLLRSDGEHEFGLARGDRHRPGSHRLHAGGAEVRDPGDRSRREAQRLGDRSSRVSDETRRLRLGRCQPCGVDVGHLDTGVPDRSEAGLGHEIQITRVVENAELGHGGADDRDVVRDRHQPVSSSSAMTFQK